MNIQKIPAAKISFGIKVPTKDVINLVSGISSKETTDVFLKLTGLSNEKMLTTMSSDAIELGRNYCAKEILKVKPEFNKLAQAKEKLAKFIKTSLFRNNGNELNTLFDAKEAEKTKLLKTMEDEIDIPPIKLPF